MIRQPWFLSAVPLVFSLTFSVNLTAPARAQSQVPQLTRPTLISVKFPAPKRGSLTTTAGGATRGSCIQGNKSLRLLVPLPVSSIPAATLSNRPTNPAPQPAQPDLTTAAHPTFFWYNPAASAIALRFSLLSDEGKEIYSTDLKPPTTPGITSFSLPTSLPPLAVNQPYKWQVTLVCNSDESDSSGNAWAIGRVVRVEPTAQLRSQLQTAAPGDRPAIYAKNELWYDTVSSLAALRMTQPNNPKFTAAWQELLESVGLDAIAQEPVSFNNPQPQ